jgi:FKBP-type peptidyl-prolyl cis-trans isomerase
MKTVKPAPSLVRAKTETTPLEFKFGADMVIKGWDESVAGLQV